MASPRQPLRIDPSGVSIGVMRYLKSPTEIHDVQLYPQGEICEANYQVLTSTGLSNVSTEQPNEELFDRIWTG